MDVTDPWQIHEMCILHLHRMTPEQMKMNPIKPIIKVKTNEELDTEDGESNSDEQESTISNKEEEEYSKFSHMSKQNSESDIDVDDNQDEQNSHTSLLGLNPFLSAVEDKVCALQVLVH